MIKRKPQNPAAAESGNKPSDKNLSPESIRQWALESLMSAVESTIDLARCGDHSYLSALDRAQLSKIKKINFDREGHVCSVEPTPLVDLVVAAASIAGSREAMKAKIEKSSKEEDDKSKKYRSNKLRIDLTGASAPASTRRKKVSPEDNVSSIIPGISEKSE